MNKVKVELFQLKKDKEYYIIDKKNDTIIFLGKLLKIEIKEEFERICWHEGPQYIDYYCLEFEKVKDKELEKFFSKFVYRNFGNWLKDYDGFYEVRL